MNKEVISDKQGIAIMVFFIIGESSILISGLSAEKDLLIAIILAMIMILPMLFIYSKLFNIYPDKDLFFLIEKTFGKIIGKIIILLYTYYTFDLASLVARDFGHFVNTVSFPETPFIVPTICIIILCAWVVKEGIEVLGRWSKFLVVLPIGLILFTTILLIPNMNIDNIRPILFNGFKPVLKGAYEVFTYPFGETVVFTIAFSSLLNKKSISKIYLRSILIGGGFILITSLVVILVLGLNSATSDYFPGYKAFTMVNIGETLQRVEIVSSTTFVLGIFVKTSIYILATCKGIAAVFGCKDFKFIVIPVSLLAINLAYFEFDSILGFNEWIFDVWTYYAFPFMVIIPILTLIVYNIRKRSIQGTK